MLLLGNVISNIVDRFVKLCQFFLLCCPIIKISSINLNHRRVCFVKFLMLRIVFSSSNMKKRLA